MPGARHRDGDSRLRRLPHGARSYAAAPEEHRFEPRLVSTLFPHLTAADMVVFRLALGVGAAVLVALALARLYPLALVVSAVLVPLLGLLSFWYVDVYEDEPVRVLLFTVAWGVGTGVGFAFLTDAVQAPHAELLSRTTAHSVVWNGVLLPVIGLALVLIGPLVLLPYRKFNDTLDGATFGGVAAITFVGASLFTHSSSFLSAGFEPVGQSTPWLLRLLTLGLVVPVIALTAVGAATGSLWLRYRAPARDRRALGVLGHPVPALIVAACALVGSALLQLYLSRWIALAALAALSVPLVLWLRQVVHVGLTEEAAERPARASRTCLNCGHAAGGGAFCSNCGVALAALPKQSRGHGPAVVLAAGGLLVAAIAVAVLLAVRPAPARPFLRRQAPLRRAAGRLRGSLDGSAARRRTHLAELPRRPAGVRPGALDGLGRGGTAAASSSPRAGGSAGWTCACSSTPSRREPRRAPRGSAPNGTIWSGSTRASRSTGPTSSR